MRIEVDTVLWSLIYTMIDEGGQLTFDQALFKKKCKELSSFFVAKTIAYKTVIPLPNIVIPNPPFTLDAGIVLGKVCTSDRQMCIQ